VNRPCEKLEKLMKALFWRKLVHITNFRRVQKQEARVSVHSVIDEDKCKRTSYLCLLAGWISEWRKTG
jgi:hypothetical protein